MFSRQLALLYSCCLTLVFLLTINRSSAQTTITYSQSFTNGVTYGSSSAEGIAWTNFCASLPSSGVTSFTMKGSNDAVGITCTDATVAQSIANTLRTGGYYAGTSDGHSWIATDLCCGMELTATGSYGSCIVGYTVRPNIPNQNWGGINSATCTGPTQTMTVVFSVCSPTVTPNTSIICSSSTTLTASAGTTYTWAPAAGLSATTGSSVTAAPIATTTYTVTTPGCAPATVTVSVDPLVISGVDHACSGLSQTLSANATGGTWASSNNFVATIGSSSGIVTGGLTAGTATISYTLGSCNATSVFTVVVAPAAITGNAAICTSASATLANTSAGGTWASGTTAVATIGSSTGIVSGLTQGTTTITYDNGCGTPATAIFTVNGAPAAITGTFIVCQGANTTLSNTATGGTWSSGNTSIATVASATGVVNGVAQGTATITYSNGCGAATTAVVTVNAAPAAITGSSIVCATSTTTLANTSTGGTWSSSTPGVATITSAGVINGITQGTTTITYNNGCGTAATQVVSVNDVPATITGTMRICSGSTTTLANAATGGTWSSSNTGVATVNITGIVSGVAQGTTTISYSNGCGADVTAIVTVDAAPAPIGGPNAVCATGGITLTNAATGGTWSSSTPSAATINSSTGDVTGVAQGTTTITYANGCGTVATTVLTVNGDPGAISGTASVCATANIILGNAATGGIWTSSNTAIATVGLFSGVATGVTQGTATITYSNGCGTDATMVVTVNDAPAAIAGPNVVCNGNTITLSNTSWAGTWASGTTGVATVGSTSGVVTGVSQGTTMITYANGCGTAATLTITVNNTPAAITGTAAVCVGLTTTLNNTSTGGVWTTSDATIAAIGSTGIVTGVAAGTATITYANGCGAEATTVVTVNANPTDITGTMAVCIGRTTTLESATIGGTWSTSASGTATVGATTGVVTGVAAGTATITYTLGTGCVTSTEVTVDPLPATITGSYSLCATTIAVLHTTSTGGTWSSSDATIVSIGATTGLITGEAAGTCVVTYTLPSGCFTTADMTVNPQPVAGTITGYTTVCIGSTATLTASVPGGTWSSVYPFATVTSLGGVVTGVSMGIDTIHYNVTNVCGTAVAAYAINVNSFSPEPVIATHTANHLCLNTKNQNFGANMAQPTGLTFTWSTSNAALVTVSPNSQFALVSFTTPGTAEVKLLATIDGSGCQLRDSFTVNVSSDLAPEISVVYYNSTFICLDNTVDIYQWGYDDSTSLAAYNISGANNQTYYLPNPDFAHRRYWVKVTRDGCYQKAYYNAPTGTFEPMAEVADVRLFPNPAESQVNLEVSGLNNTQNLLARVTDVMGRNLGEYTLNNGKATIPVAQLVSGSYYVSLMQNGVKVAAKVFVKQ